MAQDPDGVEHGDFGIHVRQWAEDRQDERSRAGLDRCQATDHFADQGFVLLPSTLQPWYAKILERYYDLLERTRSTVFGKWNEPEGGEGSVVKDEKRKLTDITEDRLLWSLTVGPVTEAVGSVGFLDVGGTAGVKRVSRDGSYLRSLAFLLLEAIVCQGFHTDGDPDDADAHGSQFALYTITAGSEGAVVDLYPGHMGGNPEKYGKVETRSEQDWILPIRVVMEPGDTLVMSGGTRHRGTGYRVQNDRFFVSFKVGASWGACEQETHQLQYDDDESEMYDAEALLKWQADLEWREARRKGVLF